MKYIRILVTYLIRGILRLYCLIPIKNNRLVFNSMAWKQYSCNPRYITEYLLSNYPGKFEVIWCFNEPEKFLDIVDREVKVCKSRTIESFYYHMTAKIIICNQTIGAEIPRRKGQYRINTWHGGGGGYKIIDYSETSKFRARLEAKEVDLYCASSETSLRNTVRVAFQHKGEVFKGTPRNDMLVNGNRTDIKENIFQYLKIHASDRVVLYAPTYREGNNSRDFDKDRYEYGLDYARLKKCMENRFGGNWIVAVRFHPRVRNYRLPNEYGIVDATNYPDMQELMASVDAMVTDYSSSIWDFSFTRKPMFLFCTDLQEYIDKRGFNKPIQEWGVSIATSNEELENNILDFDFDEFEVSMDNQHQINGSFEDGTATKRICDYIDKMCFLGE